MQPSIETIWKEGFLQDDALIAPKINDLYNQKSQHVVDKLMKMGSINLISIMVGATAILLFTIAIGSPITGLVMFTLFSWLVLYGKKQADVIRQIDKGQSSYQYLQAIAQWRKQVFAGYTRIYQIFYPALFLTVVLGFWFSNYGQLFFQKISIKFPSLLAFTNNPWYWATSLLGSTILVSLLAGTIYRIDIYLVYGNVLNKLDELLKEMEELRD